MQVREERKGLQEKDRNMNGPSLPLDGADVKGTEGKGKKGKGLYSRQRRKRPERKGIGMNLTFIQFPVYVLLYLLRGLRGKEE